jgi:hypothetical protein
MDFLSQPIVSKDPVNPAPTFGGFDNSLTPLNRIEDKRLKFWAWDTESRSAL